MMRDEDITEADYLLWKTAFFLLESEVSALHTSSKLKLRQQRMIATRARKFITKQVAAYEGFNKK